MFDFIRLVFTRPLEGVVILLCVGYLFLHVEVFEVKKAQAVDVILHSQQIVINEKVLTMSETLIRIDENVKLIKEGRLGPALP